LRPVTGRIAITSIVAVLLATVCCGVAFAYDEPNGVPPISHSGGACPTCHTPLSGTWTPTTCAYGGCHTIGGPLDATSGKGPHGLYSKTSDRCRACHTIHVATGVKLLPGATVTGTCFTCHDGTGGAGVYGAIFARTGVQPAGRHRYDTTSTVPGGSATDGGNATMAFKGPGGTLSCDDCHSPHDSNTVAPFRVERWRTKQSGVTASLAPGLTWRDATTSHLLRKNPGGSVATATVYGSDWCLACHAGRASGGALHNHPADSGAGAFTFDGVALLASDDATGVTVIGSLAETNRGYLMPYPRTAQQGTHKPICQQCHENSANFSVGGVGSLSADGTLGDALPSTITTPDGWASTDNPRFQNFPHETVNRRMLVETDDDLCLNCHPPVALP